MVLHTHRNETQPCARDLTLGCVVRNVVHERAALVFTTPSGAPIRRGSFNKLVNWRDAVASIGMPGLHFHDLRHTGNMLAAASRVSTRDLMSRMDTTPWPRR